MPKLSIIIPVYNVKGLIDRCIQSVLSQTFRDYELILIDDGSSDGSAEKCDNYERKDDRVRVIHQKNSGQSYARNVGIKMAKGEFVGFVDSDDYIEPLMYESMLESAEKNDADIVVCKLQLVEPTGKIIKVVGYDDTHVFNKLEATREILKDDMIPSFPVNKIYKRHLFKDIEFPIGRIFEDTATIYKLFYKSDKVVTISYMGYNYIQNPCGTCKARHQDINKYLNRELFNALAFDERYLFARTTPGLEEVVSLCAFKAYKMIRCFIHMLGHKKYKLTKEQKSMVDDIMRSFDTKDLSEFSLLEKMDLYMYRISEPLLLFYINIVPFFHKMKE